jgi:hypothetical protein
MGLRDILETHNLPIPDDFDERLDVIVAGLQRKPDYHTKLDAFKKKTTGGAMPVVFSPPAPGEPVPVAPAVVPDSEDYLGPRIRWFLKAVTSPYGRTLLEGTFLVVFFVSYLEKIPVFGSILSASLDVILAGGKILVKTVQSALPALIGLIPLPYASLMGIMLAAIFGMIVWPIFAMISLSRQDFVAATEAYIRTIPPPIGDVLANTFLEGNRAVAKIDEKRIKLGNDISKALTQLSAFASSASASMKEGFKSLAAATASAARTGSDAVSSVRTSVMEKAPGYANQAAEVASNTSRAARAAALNGVRAVSREASLGQQDAQAEKAPLLAEETLPPSSTPPSGLAQLRERKTAFTAPTQLRGGFHRRTKKRTWRRRRTQRRSERH